MRPTTWKSSLTYRQLLFQPEEQIARGRRDGDAVCPVASRNGISARRPAINWREVRVLLQGVAARVLPRYCDVVPNLRDSQVRQSRRLHDGNQTPEATREGIIRTAYGCAGIGLANRAVDGIDPSRAGATTTGHFVPVDAASLGEGWQTQGKPFQIDD